MKKKSKSTKYLLFALLLGVTIFAIIKDNKLFYPLLFSWPTYAVLDVYRANHEKKGEKYRDYLKYNIFPLLYYYLVPASLIYLFTGSFGYVYAFSAPFILKILTNI